MAIIELTIDGQTIEASEEMLELAAPAALMLVMGTLPILWILMRNKNTQTVI